MDALIILLAVVVVFLSIDVVKMEKTLDEIKNSINKLLPVDKYDEYCVKPLNKFTTFRVVPWGYGWQVEYRNPADTKWKVCRMEDTEDEARAEMNDIIDRLKKGEI